LHANEFKRVVGTFADPQSMVIDRSRILLEVNGTTIEIMTRLEGGSIHVEEHGQSQPAATWIMNRLGRLPMLASRILELVPDVDHFVCPSGALLKSDDTLEAVPDAMTCLRKLLNPTALETNVVYITSDAGEGKTSTINQLAREQAQKFQSGSERWLLIPIPLGGRHFLRFDDITIGALQNRLRFPFLYYESFLALVRMGVLIPAFDGFEEMFVESSSGEALTAMGVLLNSLEGQGSFAVAARNAYFEFENLRSQERLFDANRGYAVRFEKLQLSRWSREQFISYTSNRELDGEQLYSTCTRRLGSDHGLLTRAVFVRRLVDLVEANQTEDEILTGIGATGSAFLRAFVERIVEREAQEKWVDRTGDRDLGQPLLSIQQHFELLGEIALQMWELRVDHLTMKNLDFLLEYFLNALGKSSAERESIKSRAKGHALLVPSRTTNGSIEFDHDEFRFFFLGQALGTILVKGDGPQLRNALRYGALSQQTVSSLISAIVLDGDAFEAFELLMGLYRDDSMATYIPQNISVILIELLAESDLGGVTVSEIEFGPDCFSHRKLSDVRFSSCSFLPVSLENSCLQNVVFEGCHFYQLKLTDTSRIQDVELIDCKVDAFLTPEWDAGYWDPEEIEFHLAKWDLVKTDVSDKHIQVPDEEMRELQRLLRYFMRSTHIGEALIKVRHGGKAQEFIQLVVPRLLEVGVLEEIPNRGAGDQRRFKLSKHLREVNKAFEQSRGSFDNFLEIVSRA